MKTLFGTKLSFLQVLLLAILFTVAAIAQPTNPNYSSIIFSPLTLDHSWYGISTESAGDFNGDGFDDVIIGSPYPGVVYMCFGSTNMDNVPDLVFSNNNNAEFGWRVNCAGDVNGDGIDDIVIGERHYNNIGGAYIYFGGLTPNNIPDVFMTGEETILGRFGYMVSTAGDVNGDGFDDVLITDHYYGNERGRAYIFLGGAVMDNIPDVVMTGENQGDWFGNSCSSAGDVNKDGFDDFLICAVKHNSEIGKSYLFFGGSTVDNVPDLTFAGSISGQLGYVSNAGDLNGDTFDDFLIADGVYNNRQGRVFIYFGGNTPDNISDFVFYGEAAMSQFGLYSSPCGDLNRDGYSDILIGAYEFNNLSGRAYVYYGGPYLFDIPNLSLNGNYGGEERFGYSASGEADVDKDTVPEILVGAYYRGGTGGAYMFDDFPRYKISGPGVAALGSSEIEFFADFENGFWSLINDGADASISGSETNDTVLVLPGNSLGNFTLIYRSDDNVYAITKRVTVELAAPVELTFFHASVFEQNNVLLRWSTSKEVNNSGFSVQRKLVSGDWKNLGFINGKGNSPVPSDYLFEDRGLSSGTYRYRLVQTDYNGATEIFEFNGSVTIGNPNEFSLSQNYPNPFNPETRIEFAIPATTNLKIELYDITGKRVGVIYDKLTEAGYHSVSFNGSDFSSGVYVYRLSGGNVVMSKKMLLLK